ncbi:carbohydrate sulfotransferase 11-like isoform X2 [Gigantopelta aegis]|nr:carbohydrate sulfotransferase 11-like isoform X2 [Gigantopelta aegis]XP_041374638.1 carbohydrate sulfotransferase 11-like isoform X2 [Gigantopelta aegis]XP_041374639.1 carbohydrate sulfotransferase 11-like isoform X2 [Gigantopelta aegis]
MVWVRRGAIPVLCVISLVSLLNVRVGFIENFSKSCFATVRDPTAVYTERQKRLRDTCLLQPAGRLRRILSHDAYKLSYCAVPKAGCTFWINVFRFLHRETGGVNVSSPFEIPRMITHYGARQKMKYYDLDSAGDFLPYTFRFLFCRDPYTRLWSAYVDKLLLPDYWISEGQLIVARRRKHVGGGEKPCANDISFTEFLKYVTRSRIENLNEHWSPVSHMCDPCRFQPDVIGTMETFARDSRYVLAQRGLEYLMDGYDPVSHVEDEMAMLITYNFNLLAQNFVDKCSNTRDLARRLWKAFQINGYLPEDAELPVQEMNSATATTFTDLAKRTYRQNPRSSSQIKRQRMKALADAFREVPPKIMEGLKNIYATDFLMFNYDTDPSWMTFNSSHG